jgi:hypothetical protein
MNSVRSLQLDIPFFFFFVAEQYVFPARLLFIRNKLLL